MEFVKVWGGDTRRTFAPPVVAEARRLVPGDRPMSDLVLDLMADGRPRTLAHIREDLHRGYHAVRYAVRELDRRGVLVAEVSPQRHRWYRVAQ